MQNSYALTFDIDWAPDFCIDYIADILIAHKLKCTFFITHASPALERLKKYPELFELGIHPNFLKGSSHGETHEEVMKHMMQLLPNCKVVRTHALYQSATLFHLMRSQFGIEIDLSIFLNKHPNIKSNRIYYDHGDLSILHLPYFWEDDHEMYDPKQSWDIMDKTYQVPGLKIFNFHPVYVYINASEMHAYNKLKQKGYLAELPQSLFDEVRQNDKKGAGSFFIQICEFLSTEKIETHTASELARL